MLSGLNLNMGGPAAGAAAPGVAEPAQADTRPPVENVIILGSGPAGWAAAIYTARANLRPLLITGNELGGQVATTTEVENYPGFPEGIQGPELNERFQAQAEKFGTSVVIDFVTELDVDGPPFTVRTAGGATYKARSIILSVGASARKLDVPGEARLTGRGVSYCGTCDGFFFRGKEIVVVGGGDSALEEALFLTKFASKVTIVHRRGEFRAKPIAQQRVAANPKISVVWNSVVTSVNGQNKVESVTLQNLLTGAQSELRTDGVFVYVGHLPNNQLIEGKLALDEHGYVVSDRLMRTSVEGIFAAGEIQDPRFRQVATSVGQGVAAALEAQKYLDEIGDLAESQPLEAARPLEAALMMAS
jgi:thioredoxin reductase (NADPH)